MMGWQNELFLRSQSILRNAIPRKLWLPTSFQHHSDYSLHFVSLRPSGRMTVPLLTCPVLHQLILIYENNNTRNRRLTYDVTVIFEKYTFFINKKSRGVSLSFSAYRWSLKGERFAHARKAGNLFVYIGLKSLSFSFLKTKASFLENHTRTESDDASKDSQEQESTVTWPGLKARLLRFSFGFKREIM